MITTALVAALKTDVDNITFQNGHGVLLLGNTVIGDTDVKLYRFDSSSSATPDGDLVIRPSMYASTNGRLIRVGWDQYYNDLRFKAITYVPTGGEVTTALGYTPVTSTRTLTVNGTSQDLTANRTWTVGDLLSSGSYSNPTWVSNLAWSKITGTPTTISGYSISDGVTTTSLTTTLSSYATISSLTSGLATKQDTLVSGTNIKTVNSTTLLGSGNLSVGTVTSIGLSSTDLNVSGSPVTTSGSITANLTTTGISAGTYGTLTVDTKGRASAGKRQETYSGTTNASGQYTITFGTAYSAAPNIQANIINATDTQNIRITSITTTGFTVLVRNRVDIVGLLPTWNNVSGASVDVLIVEK